jgi:hypothetical protein
MFVELMVVQLQAFALFDESVLNDVLLKGLIRTLGLMLYALLAISCGKSSSIMVDKLISMTKKWW